MTVRSLIVFLERTLEWLKSMDPDLPADWQVLRCKITPPYRFTFNNEASNGSLSQRMRELSGFARPAKRRPDQVLAPRLSDREIDSTNNLVDALGENAREIRISSKGDPTVKITPLVADKIRKIAKDLRGDSHVEWTTIRGMLYQVTVSGEMRKFNIKHEVTESAIPCTFSTEALGAVKDALPSRVEVFGCARINSLGQPISIDVEHLRQLPSEDIHPDDLVGIDITGGLSAGEHLEMVRNAH